MPVMQCRAILFDLDGVLVDSRRCIELIWRSWAARRGLDAADCVVLEDSPPGVAAAKAAGMRVIALLTAHTAAQLEHAQLATLTVEGCVSQRPSA